MGSPISDGVVASPSCGQWLTSPGKQRLQAGHSFIYRLSTTRNDGKKDFPTATRKDGSRGMILTAGVGSKQPTNQLWGTPVRASSVNNRAKFKSMARAGRSSPEGSISPQHDVH